MKAYDQGGSVSHINRSRCFGVLAPNLAQLPVDAAFHDRHQRRHGPTVAVTREAITHEGDTARVWVAVDDQALELRQIKLGRAIWTAGPSAGW